MTTEIDRKFMKAIRKAIETALAEIAEKFEIQIKLGSGTYAPKFAKFPLELSAISETGEIFTEEAQAYKSNVGQKGGALESFDPDWLFKKFEYAKETYKLMGFNTRAPKYNMLIQDVATGKRHYLRSTSALKAFEEQHRDLEGWDLHRAAKENKVDIARALIARGDDVNAWSEHSSAPLHWAAIYNSLDVARLLIEKGAEVDAKDKYGWTPLYFAALNDYLDVTRLLIDKGANWEGIDLNWMDEQHRPKESPKEEVERVLSQRREINKIKEETAQSRKEAREESERRERKEWIEYMRDQ